MLRHKQKINSLGLVYDCDKQWLAVLPITINLYLVKCHGKNQKLAYLAWCKILTNNEL